MLNAAQPIGANERPVATDVGADAGADAAAAGAAACDEPQPGAALSDRDAAYGTTRAAPCAYGRFRRLTLTDFRSYARLDAALDGRPVALTGANGAGKTNLLEALSLLGPGRGLRGAKLAEVARADGDGGWAVATALDAAGADDADEPVRLGVGAFAGAPDKRACRIDGRKAAGPSALAEHVRFVWLTPAQDRLFMDGAGERRRFLDRMTQARDPAHIRAASIYEKAMRQRQRLLDDGARTGPAMDSLEMQMAEAGVALAAARRETAAVLAASDVAAEAPDFPSADVSLSGDVETLLDEHAAADAEDAYGARLRDARPLDAAAGRALVGPHRSDLLVRHRANGRAAKHCSTGEQKALLVGLVLAGALSLARDSRLAGGRAALVLLFDEIAAHLDEGRRASLFTVLHRLGAQCFMTGTDRSLFDAWGDRAQCFSVEAGALHPYEN
ncbi:MAG: DNA replication/repair protein RecF [Pseudomonadota bacterium]